MKTDKKENAAYAAAVKHYNKMKDAPEAPKMTQHQICREASLHLYNCNVKPKNVTRQRILEALSELGLTDASMKIDYRLMLQCIASMYFDRYTRRHFRSDVRLTDIPALH